MAVFGWNFTQLRWDGPKPLFVFLSISVFAVSWSHGLNTGYLLLHLCHLHDWLMYGFPGTQGSTKAVTNMFSFLCGLSSPHSASQFYSHWANICRRHKKDTKTARHKKSNTWRFKLGYVLTIFGFFSLQTVRKLTFWLQDALCHNRCCGVSAVLNGNTRGKVGHLVCGTK